MKTFVISSSTYIIEAAAELLLISSLIGKKKKDLLSPFLPLIFICGIINNALFIFIPNVLGWFLAFPISLITYSIILRIRVSACIFPFLLSFATCGLIEAITVIIFPFAIFTLSDVSTQLVGNCVIFIISIFISLLPLNKLYLFANKGKLIFKLILSYVSLLYIVTVALTKIDSIDAIAILPMTVTFMVILLLADIMVLNQQRTITIQQQDIKDYQTYEPMAHDLISDILGKQHDFNNQMNAIRMLPYTYKDYDLLSDAIANYSTFLEEEFNESELLKINLPVVAGFVFSKIKEAEQKGRLISVKIKVGS